MKFEPHPIYVKSIMLVSVLNLELYLDIDRTCVYVIITLDTPCSGILTLFMAVTRVPVAQ